MMDGSILGLDERDFVELTATSLTLSADLGFDRYCSLGKLLGEIRGSLQWWLGDWINFGQERYGQEAFRRPYAAAVEATGLSMGTLENYALVARAIHPSRRRLSCTYSIHACVTSLSDDEQDRWLGRAAEGRWTVAKLKSELRSAGLLPAQPPRFYLPSYDMERIVMLARELLRNARPLPMDDWWAVNGELIGALQEALKEGVDSEAA